MLHRQRVYFSLANKTYYTNPYEGQWNFELNVYRQALDVLKNLSANAATRNFKCMACNYLIYHIIWDQENDAIDLRLKNLCPCA